MQLITYIHFTVLIFTSLFLVFSCAGEVENLAPNRKPIEIIQDAFSQQNSDGWPDLHIKRDRILKLIKLSFNPFEIKDTELTPEFWEAFKLLISVFAPGGEKIPFSSLFFQFSDEQRLKLVRIFEKLIRSRNKGISQIKNQSIRATFKRLRHLEVVPERPDTSWYRQKRHEIDAFIFNFDIAGILAGKGYNIFDVEKSFSSEDRVLAEADILVKTNSGSLIWIEVKSHLDIKATGRAERDIFKQLDHLKSHRLQEFFARNHINIQKVVLVSRDSVSEETRVAILARHLVSIFDFDQIFNAKL